MTDQTGSEAPEQGRIDVSDGGIETEGESVGATAVENGGDRAGSDGSGATTAVTSGNEREYVNTNEPQEKEMGVGRLTEGSNEEEPQPGKREVNGQPTENMVVAEWSVERPSEVVVERTGWDDRGQTEEELERRETEDGGVAYEQENNAEEVVQEEVVAERVENAVEETGLVVEQQKLSEVEVVEHEVQEESIGVVAEEAHILEQTETETREPVIEQQMLEEDGAIEKQPMEETAYIVAEEAPVVEPTATETTELVIEQQIQGETVEIVAEEAPVVEPTATESAELVIEQQESLQGGGVIEQQIQGETVEMAPEEAPVVELTATETTELVIEQQIQGETVEMVAEEVPVVEPTATETTEPVIEQQIQGETVEIVAEEAPVVEPTATETTEPVIEQQIQGETVEVVVEEVPVVEPTATETMEPIIEQQIQGETVEVVTEETPVVELTATVTAELAIEQQIQGETAEIVTEEVAVVEHMGAEKTESIVEQQVAEAAEVVSGEERVTTQTGLESVAKDGSVSNKAQTTALDDTGNHIAGPDKDAAKPKVVPGSLSDVLHSSASSATQQGGTAVVRRSALARAAIVQVQRVNAPQAPAAQTHVSSEQIAPLHPPGGGGSSAHFSGTYGSTAQMPPLLPVQTRPTGARRAGQQHPAGYYRYRPEHAPSQMLPALPRAPQIHALISEVDVELDIAKRELQSLQRVQNSGFITVPRMNSRDPNMRVQDYKGFVISRSVMDSVENENRERGERSRAKWRLSNSTNRYLNVSHLPHVEHTLHSQRDIIEHVCLVTQNWRATAMAKARELAVEYVERHALWDRSVVSTNDEARESRTLLDEWPPEFSQCVQKTNDTLLMTRTGQDQPMYIDSAEAESFAFYDMNSLVADPVTEHNAYRKRLVWTDAEVKTFVERYAQHPKEFKRISVGLPAKTVKDVIEFYNINRIALNLKAIVVGGRKRASKKMITEGLARK